MKRRMLYFLILAVLPGSGLKAQVAQAPAEEVTLVRQIPAFSLSAPNPQRGFFPQGSRLVIMNRRPDGFVHVRFQASDGRLIEALCRPGDLGMAPPPSVPAGPSPAMSASPGRGGAYEDRTWLVDSKGHEEAVKLQAKFQAPLLIFWHADWNEDCQFLWKELLDTSEFKTAAKGIIKLKINPEHGKEEGWLANRYSLSKYPTTMMLDKPQAKPRSIELFYWSFGKRKARPPDYAMQEVMNMSSNRNPWTQAPKTNAPAEPEILQLP